MEQKEEVENQETKLEWAFKTILRIPTFHNRHVKYALHGIYALATEKFNIRFPGLNEGIRLFLKRRIYFNALKDFSESIHAIDDRLDEMSAEDILASGKAHTGKQASQFLFNKSIFLSEDYEHAKKMLDLGFFSEEEGIAFANLAATLVQEEAGYLMEYQQNHQLESRQAMLETDRKLTEVLLGFIIHWFSRSSGITDAVHDHGLVYEDIITAYPKVTLMFRNLELKDDFQDILEDLEQEIATGRPVANWYLTKLQERGKLLDEHGDIQAYLKEFLLTKRNCKSNIHIEDFPEPLQMILQEATEEYKTAAQQIPKGLRDVLKADWEVNIEKGCYPSSRKASNRQGIAF